MIIKNKLMCRIKSLHNPGQRLLAETHQCQGVKNRLKLIKKD